MWKVSVPLKVKISKRKDWYLNLNQYRNTHFMVLNKAKHIFKDILTPGIYTFPRFNHIKITYIFYPSTKRKCDISNVCSIVDKFFSDALVELGKLPDDNYNYLDEISYKYGQIDPINPRVDVIIEEK